MDARTRNYGVDILKILLAFMVLTHHFYAGGTGQVLMHTTEAPWRWIASGLCYLCYPAVNGYILISSFFLYKQQKNITTTIKSIIRLWFAILFYSLFGYALLCVVSGEFHWIELIKRFFPVSRGKWWFFTVYIAIILLSPYLNRLVDAISQREHRFLLAILLLCCSIIPGFVNWEGHLGTNYGFSLLWFIVLYITGTYLSKYAYISEEKSFTIFAKSVFLYFLIAIFAYLVTAFSSRVGVQITLNHYNCLNVYFQALLLIWGFLHLPVSEKSSKFVGEIASLSMAAYLVHCQEDIELLLWSNVKAWNYANSPSILWVLFCVVGSLFLISITVEKIRVKCFHINQFQEKVVNSIVAVGKKCLRFL